MAEKFNWLDDESICIRRIDGLAVYANTKGDIVIRQQSNNPHDEDSFVYVPVEYAENLISKLQSVIIELQSDDE